MLLAKNKNPSFMIHKLGKDCLPSQQYRELTQNGVDAIGQLPDHKGKVLWTYEEVEGVRKLCIIDTGCGMDPFKAVEFVNDLNCSSGNLSDLENFGIGAKIAAGYRNPEGVEYQTWRDGKGHRLLFHREGAKYGLLKLRPELDDDDEAAYFELLPASSKPKDVKANGTKVILHGSSPNHDTWTESQVLLAKKPTDLDFSGRWLIKYTNTRWWTVPEGVSIHVREQRAPDEKPTERLIKGARYHLDRECEKKGQVTLSDVVVHWFIHGAGGAENYTGSPFVATIFQHELYDQLSANEANVFIRNSGIFINSHRVVLVFEPQGLEVMPDTVRAGLRLDNKPLPYDRWQTEFNENLPEELERLLDDVRPKDKRQTDDRIMDLVDRLAPRRTVLRRNGRIGRGEEGHDQHTSGEGGTNPIGTEPNGGGGGGGGGRPGGRPPTKPGGPTAPEGSSTVGSHVKKVPLPEIVWVALNPPSSWKSWVSVRSPGEMEEDAGCYVKASHNIKMNADFPTFNLLIEEMKKEFKGYRVPNAVIAESVHHWIGARVKEMVAHVMRRQGASPTWMATNILERLTESHITAAAIGFRDVWNECKKAIATKIQRTGRRRRTSQSTTQPAPTSPPVHSTVQ